MSDRDVDRTRAEMLELWERAAPGWERRASWVREGGMPVSVWMIEQLSLAPGKRVLELAAGTGDTGFLASELIGASGTLICSDAAEGMLEVAQNRAGELAVRNVEFKRLELEWIDLPAASVDAALCRWGLMLTVDPAAATHEIRRVLTPGGRVAVAVWDDPSLNPWATIPNRALISLGLTPAPDPGRPGMFALSHARELRELLEGAGFVDVVVDSIELDRSQPSLDEFLEMTLDLARPFADVWEGLTEDQREEVRREVASLAGPFTAADGSLRLSGRSLVAAAGA